MICQVSTGLNEDNLALLGSDDEPAKNKLIHSLFMGLEDEEKESLLAGFCTSDPRETFVRLDTIEEVSWDSPTKGFIEVTFSSDAYYGCKDYNRDYDYTEVANFLVNHFKKIITFTTDVPDLPERDTVEEF
jgi:hypothetical protein